MPKPVLIAGMIVLHTDGSKSLVDIGPASGFTVRTRRSPWRRRRTLTISFPDFEGPVQVKSVPSGIIHDAPADLPEMPVDTTDTRYDDARRLNAA